MPNQIMVIAPYWVDDLGAWVFDDPKVGLEQEPFVSGVPEMIDFLVQDIPNAKSGFRMTFLGRPVSRLSEETGLEARGNGRQLVRH